MKITRKNHISFSRIFSIQVFRKMDTNNDMKVTSDEFIEACLKDEKLMELLEGFIAAI